MGVPELLCASYSTARKYRRFDLQFPVALNFQSNGKLSRLEGVSKNVSVGGMLLSAGAQIPLRTKVRLVIDVASAFAGRPIHLIADGKVVRIEPLANSRGFAIAVECKHPISKMMRHLRSEE